MRLRWCCLLYEVLTLGAVPAAAWGQQTDLLPPEAHLQKHSTYKNLGTKHDRDLFCRWLRSCIHF